MCSELTIFCSCSIVGRLTIVMVSPRLAGADAGGIGAGRDGNAARLALDGARGDDETAGGLVACRTGARVAPEPGAGAGATGCADARLTAPRLAGRRAPIPSISARPPACTAWASTSRSMRPRSTTTMRSATSSTRSRFCSTTISDSLSRLRSATRISPISCTIDGWMPSDGSSSSSNHGAGTSARPSARICCSPPDNAPPLRSSSGRSRGNASTTRSMAAGSISPASGVQARRRFSSAVRPGRMPRPCGDIAQTQAATFVRLHARDVDAVDRDPPCACRHQADQRLQQGGLAHAVVADDADCLAFAQQEIDAVQHRQLPITRAQTGDVEHDIALCGIAVGGVLAVDGIHIGLAHFARLPM